MQTTQAGSNPFPGTSIVPLRSDEIATMLWAHLRQLEDHWIDLTADEASWLLSMVERRGDYTYTAWCGSPIGMYVYQVACGSTFTRRMAAARVISFVLLNKCRRTVRSMCRRISIRLRRIISF